MNDEEYPKPDLRGVRIFSPAQRKARHTRTKRPKARKKPEPRFVRTCVSLPPELRLRAIRDISSNFSAAVNTALTYYLTKLDKLAEPKA